MTKSVMWPYLGKIAGYLVPSGKVERLSRPPTLITPSESIIGLSLRRGPEYDKSNELSFCTAVRITISESFIS